MPTWGADVSYFQDKLDLRTLPGQGYSFVVARIAYGARFPDPMWPTFRQQAAEAGLLFSGYHFLLASQSLTAQAATVANHIGDRSVPVDLDVESSGGANLQHVLGFIKACHGYGLRIGKLYLPRSWWQQIRGPKLPSKLALWNAAYPGGYPPAPRYGSALYPGDGHPQWAAYGGKAVDLWQFTSSGRVDGFPRGIDLDCYRGTRDELAATGWFKDYAKHTPKPPAPKPPAPKPPTPPTKDEVDMASLDDIRQIVREEIQRFASEPIGEHGPVTPGNPKGQPWWPAAYWQSGSLADFQILQTLEQLAGLLQAPKATTVAEPAPAAAAPEAAAPAAQEVPR